jgi:hypothetical protein
MKNKDDPRPEAPANAPKGDEIIERWGARGESMMGFDKVGLTVPR